MKSFYLYLLIVLSANTFAQIPGTLNPAFSENGWDTIYGNNNGFEITRVLIQPDEKILVCAEANFSNEGHQAVILRYTNNGNIDPDFGGGDGMVKSKEDESINLYTRAAGMALQSTGKIIVAGDQFYNSERIFRLNPDGTLDGTFGTDGVVDINRPNSEFIYHVAVQSDDKIIVCGKESRFVSGVLEPHVFLWRFTPDGAMDMSFGNAGVVSYNSQAWLGTFETYLIINDLIVLPNDDILINQSFTKYPDSFVMLSKLNASGAFDQSFGVAGHYIKSVKSNDGNYTYSSAAVQENGSVISTFTTRDTINLTYTESVFRVDAQGQADPSLNLNIGIPEYFPIKTKILVSDNLFYYCRKSDHQTGYSYDVIHCYDLNGIPVNAFGINGVAFINQNDIPASATTEMAVDGNGDIYISSGTSDPDNTDNLLFLTSQVTGAEINVSTNDRLTDEIIAVYPNPSSGIFYLNSISNTSGNIKIDVLNTLGQIVFSETDFKITKAIDLGAVPHGIYFIHISNSSNQLTFKILKQ
ncbi:MAG: T9SS type A sorting domain-containing protein [Bacteroidales bacterium]|nr:T9SS type A sorting domain-containing protein [Bacteroidales bacterium]